MAYANVAVKHVKEKVKSLENMSKFQEIQEKALKMKEELLTSITLHVPGRIISSFVKHWMKLYGIMQFTRHDHAKQSNIM